MDCGRVSPACPLGGGHSVVGTAGRPGMDRAGHWRWRMSGGVGHLILSGPLLFAVPVAAAAGAVTFLSPCVLPLVPGYLSYVTGMSGPGTPAPGPAAGPASGADSTGGDAGSPRGDAGSPGGASPAG